MSPPIVGLIVFAIFFILMFLRMPIGLAMGLSAVLGMMYLVKAGAALNIAGMMPFRTSLEYVYSVLPLFLLMGQLVTVTGVSTDLYRAAYKLVGHIRGGLCIATTIACAAFAAICGDALTGTATFGTVAFPEMKRYKYNTELAAGTIAAGGTLGILIPPSLVFIIYGMITANSIGALFISGIIPGLLMAALYTITIYLICRFRPDFGPAGPRSTPREQLSAVLDVWPAVLLFLIVIGGIYFGVFTATEAAAFGAFWAFIIVLLKRRITRQNFTQALLGTLKLLASIFVLFAGAMVFSVFLTMSELPNYLAAILGGSGLSPTVIALLIIFMYMILGCVMDAVAMILLVTPLVYPLVLAIGFDPLWFGVITVISVMQGGMTPPVGLNCFIMHQVQPDVPLSTIFRGVMPFWGATMVTIFIVLLFPQLATFLPGLMMR